MTAEGVRSTVLQSVTGMPRYVLRLPYDKPPLSLNDRGRSRKAMLAKSRKIRELRAAVTTVGRSLKMAPAPHLHVVLHYVAPDQRVRDRDNLVATLKPCIDALTARGQDRGWACLSLVPDDDPEHVSWSAPVILPPDEHGPRVWLVVQALVSPPPPLGSSYGYGSDPTQGGPRV